MTFLLAFAATLGVALLWCFGFYVGFKLGRRTMMRDLAPYLPREPDGNFPFADPLA